MIKSPSDINIREAASLLREGKLVSFPTETVYGLGASALDENAIREIYKLKGRPSNNPLIVHVDTFQKVLELINKDSSPEILNRLNLLKTLWPGPLTVIVPKSEKISTEATGGNATVGIRIPNHPVALKLLKDAGIPIVAPSANISTYISPTTAEHVAEAFGQAIPVILDGGPCKVGIESTVVSLIGEHPTILRPGFITKEDLELALNERVLIKNSNSEIMTNYESPGQMNLHYAPKTPCSFISDESLDSLISNSNSALLSLGPINKKESSIFSRIEVLSETGNLEEVSEKLFNTLRILDAEKHNHIFIDRSLIEAAPSGLGIAILDRLNRATANNE